MVPRLYDAVVRWIGDGAMTINGFERDAVIGHCTAQSWYIQLITDADDGAAPAAGGQVEA